MKNSIFLLLPLLGCTKFDPKHKPAVDIDTTTLRFLLAAYLNQTSPEPA